MKRTYIALIAIFIVINLIGSSVIAQTGFSGKDFWLAFPQNARFERFAGLRFTVYIVGAAGTTGELKEFATGRTTAILIPANGIQECIVDSASEQVSVGVHHGAVHVSTSATVNVIVTSYRPASTDSYAALSTQLLGTDYSVIGYDPIIPQDQYRSQCDIIGTEDNTTVTLSFPPEKQYPGLDNVQHLQSGDVLHLGGRNGPMDITGVMIHADKAVAVVTGHTCAQVPSDVFYCDLLMEMIPPVTKLGKNFAVGTFEGQLASSVRVVADTDNTIVSINGMHVGTLRKGEYYQNDTLKVACMLSVTKPAYAMQYMHSSQESVSGSSAADPSMVILTPNDRMLSQVESLVPAHVKLVDGVLRQANDSSSWQDWLRIVTKKESVAKIVLNGRRIPSSLFKPINGGDFVTASVRVTPGRIELAGGPFAAYNYGIGLLGESAFESYAHNVGMDLR